ncbi:MAG TPA: addiction module antidote protein, HigA family [Sutterella sp.]|nr:addiction module antidote protein, HigA family [Sutterella sp.]
MTEKIFAFDAVEYLETEEDVALFVSEALATGDARHIDRCVGIAKRAKVMSPGELLAIALSTLHMSAREFAEHTGVDPDTLASVLNETVPITPALAARLAKALPGPTAETWLSLQADHDLRQTEKTTDGSFITHCALPTNSTER